MTRVRLSGTVPVALPPEEAFGLFTPSGERRWAQGWEPRFPHAPEEEASPGTVFEIERAGRRETWLVAAAVPGEWILYARVGAGDRAGLVRVECSATPAGTTLALVSYDLTALSERSDGELLEFAAGFERFLDHWRAAIAGALST